ncbi:MAG: hypothetical protein JWN37_36 [Candidatus Nomurabacteria bacterium]|nr:hypothetical protein [Candidatus Nomurabacteria bacterium]
MKNSPDFASESNSLNLEMASAEEASPAETPAQHAARMESLSAKYDLPQEDKSMSDLDNKTESLYENRGEYENMLKVRSMLTGISPDDFRTIDAYTENFLREDLQKKQKGFPGESSGLEDYLFNPNTGVYSRLIGVTVKEGGDVWARIIDDGKEIVGVTTDGTKVVFSDGKLVIRDSDGNMKVMSSTYEEAKREFNSDEEEMLFLGDKEGRDRAFYSENAKTAGASVLIKDYKIAQDAAIERLLWDKEHPGD